MQGKKNNQNNIHSISQSGGEVIFLFVHSHFVQLCMVFSSRKKSRLKPTPLNNFIKQLIKLLFSILRYKLFIPFITPISLAAALSCVTTVGCQSATYPSSFINLKLHISYLTFPSSQPILKIIITKLHHKLSASILSKLIYIRKLHAVKCIIFTGRIYGHIS